MKYYAIRGNEYEGIYYSWEECENKRKGGQCKSFKNENDAIAFVKGELDYEYGKHKEEKENFTIEDDIYSFVDGSFNPATNTYGCGGFLVVNNTKYEISASACDDLSSMRNVAGEILGSRLAVEKAISLGLCEINIYYDYLGIEKWATHEWKANKPGTIDYVKFIDSVSDKIKINFKKVRGHIGIDGNEEADKLAKKAVGIE